MLRDALLLTEANDPDTSRCLGDDIIAALAEGADAATRAQALPHLTACARCRAAVGSVARAMRDDAVAAASGTRVARIHALIKVAVPLAAAATLLLLLKPLPRPGNPVHRDPTITAAQSPTPLGPLGGVTAVPRLLWSAVPNAELYRVTLFDSASRVRFEGMVTDTALVVPDSLRLDSGTYLWKVEARVGRDRWAGSNLVEFRLTR